MIQASRGVKANFPWTGGGGLQRAGGRRRREARLGRAGAAGAAFARGAKSAGLFRRSSSMRSDIHGARDPAGPGSAAGALLAADVGRRRKSLRSARLDGEQGMDDGADRDHAEARLVFRLLVVESRLRLGRAVLAAVRPFVRAGDGRSQRRRPRPASRMASAAKAAPLAAIPQGEAGKEAARDRKHGVADDPAEPGRQRPASGRRQERSQRRRRGDADEIEADLQPRVLEPALG